MRLTRGKKDTITNSNIVYIDNERVGKIILDAETPYFNQEKNFSLRLDELEKVINLMNSRFNAVKE